MSASRSLFCRLCNKRFSSESELFEHNLSWEHRSRQDLQSSRSSSSDTSYRGNPKLLPHAKPSHDAPPKGKQSQQPKSFSVRTQPPPPPHGAPPYYYSRSRPPPPPRGPPPPSRGPPPGLRHPPARGPPPAPRDLPPGHRYVYPSYRCPPLMDYESAHRYQLDRYQPTPHRYPVPNRYLPPTPDRASQGEYHSPRSGSERLYNSSRKGKPATCSQKPCSQSDVASASLYPAKQSPSNKVTSTSESNGNTTLQAKLQVQPNPQRPIRDNVHFFSTSSTAKDYPLQSNATSIKKKSASIVDSSPKLVPPLTSKRIRRRSQAGEEVVLQPMIPVNENFIPLEMETEDSERGESTATTATANAAGEKLVSSALPFAGTIYDSSTDNNREPKGESLRNAQANSAAMTNTSSSEEVFDQLPPPVGSPMPLSTDTSCHGSNDEPVPMDLCIDTDSNDDVFSPYSAFAKDTQSGTSTLHSTSSFMVSDTATSSHSSLPAKKMFVSELSTVIPSRSSIVHSEKSGLSELLKATTLVLASVSRETRHDPPTKAPTSVPLVTSCLGQTRSTASERVSSLVTSVLQADVAKQLATSKKAALSSKPGTPKGKRKIAAAVSSSPQKRRRMSSSDTPSPSGPSQDTPTKQRKRLRKKPRTLEGSASFSEAQNTTVTESNDQTSLFFVTEKERLCDHDSLKQSIFLKAQKLQALGAPLPHQKQNRRPTQVQISHLHKQSEESDSPTDTVPGHPHRLENRLGTSTNIPMRSLKATKVSVSRNSDGCERAIANVLSKTLQETVGAVLSGSPSGTPGTSPVHSPRRMTKPTSLPILQPQSTTEGRQSPFLSSNEHTPQGMGEEPRKLGSYSPSNPDGPPPLILHVSSRAESSSSLSDASRQSPVSSTIHQPNSVGCTWKDCNETVFRPGAKLCSEHNHLFEKLLASSGITQVTPQTSSTAKKPSKQRPKSKSVLFGELAGAPSWMLSTTAATAPLSVHPSMEEVPLSPTTPAEAQKTQKASDTQETTPHQPATETPVDSEEITGGDSPGGAGDLPNPPKQKNDSSFPSISETVGNNPPHNHTSTSDRRPSMHETPQVTTMSPSFGQDFKAEITVLNATEKQLQEDLVGAQSDLLAAIVKIEQVEKDLEKVKGQQQQLQDKGLELTQQYKEVLWKKQSVVLHPLQKSIGPTREERANSSGSQHLTLVAELAALNQREQKLQEELTDTHLQLSEVHGKIEESERELEGLRTSEQQSREKAEKVTSEYQEVLTQKHNLLLQPMQWSATSALCMASSTPQSTSSSCLLLSTTTTTSSVLPAQNEDNTKTTTLAETMTTTLTETSDENPLPHLSGQEQLHGSGPPQETTPGCHMTTMVIESQSEEAAMDQTTSQSSSKHPSATIFQEIQPADEGAFTEATVPLGGSLESEQQVEEQASRDAGMASSEGEELVQPERSDVMEHAQGVEQQSTASMRRGSTSLLDTIATSHLEQSSNKDERVSREQILRSLRLMKDGMDVDSIGVTQSESFETCIDESGSSSDTQNGGTSQAGPSGQVVPVFKPHESSVLAMKVSGNRLYTCSADKSIRAYDTLTGELIHSYHPHQRSVTCLELYQKDGTTFLLSGSSDKILHQYNAKTGKLETKYKCGVRIMYMCAEGAILYVGLSSGSILVIDLELNESIGKHSCSANHSSISCLCAAPGILFSAAFDMSITCWDVREALEKRFTEDTSFGVIHRLTSFENTVLCMKIHNDHLYSGCGDKTVQIHNIKTWERVGIIRGHSGAVSGLQIMGKVLITACFDQLVRCFDIERLQLLQVYGGHSDMVFTISTANGMIYTGLKNGTVQATPLDLTVFYECQWTGCGLRFGIFQHLKDHVKGHLELGDDGQYTCRWNECSERLEPPQGLHHLWQHVS